MSQFIDYVLRLGPLDGQVLTFFTDNQPERIEFRTRGLKQCPSLYHRYELAGNVYRHVGVSCEPTETDWQDDAWAEVYATVKGNGDYPAGEGKYRFWCPDCELNKGG